MFSILRLPRWTIVLVLCLLGVTAFLYLGADFPHHSRWMDDTSRYTDDGWYAGGAINHTLFGRWITPGDFNPFVGVPGWSVMLGLLFHFTGVSVVAARALAIVFGIGTVLLAGATVRRSHPQLERPMMLLMAASPLFFFFGRTAIIEPSLIFLLVASIWAAHTASYAGNGRLALCGIFFAAAMIDKGVALFVAPAVLYLVWFPYRRDWRKALRAPAIPVAIFAVLELLFILLWLRPHAVDFNYYSRMNTPQLNARSLEKFARALYRCVTWIDPILFPMLALGVVASCTRSLRSLWEEPLYGSSMLFFWGYVAFFVLHIDAMPHYFAVIVFPTMLMLLLLLHRLQVQQPRLGQALGVVITLVVVLNLGLIARYMMHPRYTQRDAYAQIKQQIDAHPEVNRLLYGHADEEATFYTGIPALDDMGPMPGTAKLRTFHPGWSVYQSNVLWGLDNPELTAQYRFVPVAVYPIFDEDNTLTLFRIVAK